MHAILFLMLIEFISYASTLKDIFYITDTHSYFIYPKYSHAFMCVCVHVREFICTSVAR